MNRPNDGMYALDAKRHGRVRHHTIRFAEIQCASHKHDRVNDFQLALAKRNPPLSKILFYFKLAIGNY